MAHAGASAAAAPAPAAAGAAADGGGGGGGSGSGGSVQSTLQARGPRGTGMGEGGAHQGLTLAHLRADSPAVLTADVITLPIVLPNV